MNNHIYHCFTDFSVLGAPLNLADGAMIRVALIIVFSAGSGEEFYVAKGFFDTISKSLDEAAIIDGNRQMIIAKFINGFLILNRILDILYDTEVLCGRYDRSCQGLIRKMRILPRGLLNS